MTEKLIGTTERAEGAIELLSSYAAVVIPKYFDAERCATWTEGVYAAREEWTKDFDGEQFSLGRAFYTHLETGRSKSYFEDTAMSDARVERFAPGLQRAMFDLARLVVNSKHVIQRRGWCGPGVHVFPPNGPVAERGGVQHYDTEGLTAHHIEQRRPAVTLVAMLQPTEEASECALRVWDVLYSGSDDPTDSELERPNDVAIYETGDVILINSYRLHQIHPFKGNRDRISATIHAAQSDTKVWECWF